MRYTHFGHSFNDKVSATIRHSGIDLNYGAPSQDKGKEVASMADGVVVYSANTGAGWGNLMVVHHPKYNVWTRYAHLEKIYYKKGAEVNEGTVIGTCGGTGGNWSPHLHWDVILKPLPKGWTQYTSYWSYKKVMEYYTDPIPYVNGINSVEEPADPWYKEAQDWVAKNKISNGEDPNAQATRAEVWQMLHSYDQKFNK